MPRTARYATIEGQFASGVLGTFRIIRGFATLQELAEISAPYEMTPPAHDAATVSGYQRDIDPQHAADIKRYLETGKLRFVPEIILAVRCKLEEIRDTQQRVIGVRDRYGTGFTIGPRGRGAKTHRIRVDIDDSAWALAGKNCIRRIDGNHRLHLAANLALDDGVPTKYLAPFCAVLLGPPGDPNDDFVESMLFHTINSTALPLDSEHALQLIFGQTAGFAPTPDEEFASSPPLHLARLLKTRLDRLAPPQRDQLGTTPATVLHAAAKAMIAADAAIQTDRATIERFADELYGALTAVLAQMPATAPELCAADFFIELASLAWRDSPGHDHNERITRTAATLEAIGRWLGRDGLHRLHEKRSLAGQLFELYRSVRNRIPKRVFLARWYPVAADGDELRRANLRKQEIDRALTDLRGENIDLALDDPGTQTGSTFPIHQRMYEAIARNDIILVDLSGVRPNVCVEAGYALERHDKGRLLFLFQPTGATDSNRAYEDPPFDLNTFRYERITDAAEIPDKIKPHLRTIWQEAMAGTA